MIGKVGFFLQVFLFVFFSVHSYEKRLKPLIAKYHPVISHVLFRFFFNRLQSGTNFLRIGNFLCFAATNFCD